MLGDEHKKAALAHLNEICPDTFDEGEFGPWEFTDLSRDGDEWTLSFSNSEGADVVFKIHPLTDVDAQEMIRGIKGYAILSGARGEKPVDEAFLTDCLLRLSQLLTDFPFIEEMDINPLIVGAVGEDTFVVDVRLRINPDELGYGGLTDPGKGKKKKKGRKTSRTR